MVPGRKRGVDIRPAHPRAAKSNPALQQTHWPGLSLCPFGNFKHFKNEEKKCFKNEKSKNEKRFKNQKFEKCENFKNEKNQKFKKM